VARFIGARADEIVFTRGATEALNLVAQSWGSRLGPGDEVALSVAEHHANLVPWQLLTQRTGCTLRFALLDPRTGAPSVDSWAAVIGPRTRLVATCHVSNVLSHTAPVEQLVEMARRVGAAVLLDASQSVPSRPVDVRRLGVDFLVASGHKMAGPTGIGFLWASADTLASMPPWQGGGEMIDSVSLEASTFAPPPARFEAGTPPIAAAVGLAAACDYLTSLGMERVEAHERNLGEALYDALRGAVPGLTVLGPPAGRAGLAAFVVDGVHATDLSTLADAQGVALRSGHHCAQPLHNALGVAASCRASGYVYTTLAEVDEAARVLRDAAAFLREAT
jgi:cysteine desulfurase/selenocysteine lyase